MSQSIPIPKRGFIARILTTATAIALTTTVFSSPLHAQSKEIELLNVSYDPTRELYEAYNSAFSKHWKATTGQTLVIRQSHGGSSKQARAVLDGLEADVVTLALEEDISVLAKANLIASNWEKRLPHRSTPYTSTIVFLVRKGNPKKIKDWNDLVRSGVSVITPNPKTSGAARWGYLAAYGYALDHNKNSEQAARNFIKALYQNVPVLDAGARGSTTTFLERGIGDVLLSWENEALLAVKKLGASEVEIVIPPTSILAEPPVAVVDKVVDKRGTRKVATEYLRYLESPDAQKIVAEHFYRPRNEKVAAQYAAQFPKLTLFSIDRFGGWEKVQKTHFADDGVFDQIYKPTK